MPRCLKSRHNCEHNLQMYLKISFPKIFLTETSCDVHWNMFPGTPISAGIFLQVFIKSGLLTFARNISFLSEFHPRHVTITSTRWNSHIRHLFIINPEHSQISADIRLVLSLKFQLNNIYFVKIGLSWEVYSALPAHFPLRLSFPLVQPMKATVNEAFINWHSLNLSLKLNPAMKVNENWQVSKFL